MLRDIRGNFVNVTEQPVAERLGYDVDPSNTKRYYRRGYTPKNPHVSS